MKIISILLITFVLSGTNINYTKKNSLPKEFIKLKIDTINHSDLQNQDWDDLKMYIGEYSKETDFFENPIIKNELVRILGASYESYNDHVKLSGCGEIEYRYGLMYGDVSQLHVGGYTSFFIVDIKNREMYLFWLTETVSSKKYKLFGDKPTPSNVLDLIINEMNIKWGHVADFKIENNEIKIEKK